MNEELRAITKNQRSLDRAVMMSSLMPSEKYSCSGSPLMLTKGSTAMAGRSGSGNAGRDCSWMYGGLRLPKAGSVPSCLDAHGADEAETFARDGADQFLVSAAVANRVSRGLMRLVRVESDTIRPPQIEAIRSSLLTTRSRFCTRYNQQIEHLRLDGDGLGTAAQLAARRRQAHDLQSEIA